MITGFSFRLIMFLLLVLVNIASDNAISFIKEVFFTASKSDWY